MRKCARCIFVYIQGYVSTSEVHEVEDVGQMLSAHSVVCSYDELLQMSVARDEQLKQSYIADIWRVLDILLESKILSWAMLRPVLLFVKSGLDLNFHMQVDNVLDFNVLGYLKDLPILW